MDIYGKSPALTFLSHPWRTYRGRLHIPRQQTLLSSSHSWAGVSVPRAGDGCLQREVRRGSDRGQAEGLACGSGTFPAGGGCWRCSSAASYSSIGWD